VYIGTSPIHRLYGSRNNINEKNIIHLSDIYTSSGYVQGVPEKMHKVCHVINFEPFAWDCGICIKMRSRDCLTDDKNVCLVDKFSLLICRK